MKKNVIFFFSVLLMASLISFTRSSKEDEPLTPDYNHKKHIDDVGLSCVDCHQSVETLPAAGMPRLQDCLACHEEPVTENPEEKKLQTIASNNGKLHWRRIYRMHPDVYFSHRRHVGIAKITCESCHGDIKELTHSPQTKEIDHSMEFCMDCHTTMNVDNDCIACHR